MDFEPVTILYGGNGSGKSTALNVIAKKLGVLRDSVYNQSNFYQDYVNLCEASICNEMSTESRIITSDDVFDYILNVRNLNQGIDQKRENLFEEYLEDKYSTFLLAMRGAKIYDLNQNPACTKEWTRLGNVRTYYDFFMKHKEELEDV